MFIHRENALKAHQHISYCPIQRYHLKKTNIFNTKTDQNIIKTHQIANFFKIFSQGSMPPSMCAADIIIFISIYLFFFRRRNTSSWQVILMLM